MASGKSVEAKMGDFLLKGYCMLNQTCPVDGSIPMFRKRDGTIICCCCSAECKYNEGHKLVQPVPARIAGEEIGAEAPPAKVQKHESVDSESARDKVQPAPAYIVACEDMGAEAPHANVQKHESAATESVLWQKMSRNTEMQRRAQKSAAEMQELVAKPALMQDSPDAESAKDVEMQRRAEKYAAEIQGSAAQPSQGTGRAVQGGVSSTQRPKTNAEDPSAAMGKYLLQGYCMLSESCPNGSGVPLLRGRDGSLVCCCGDACCTHSRVAPSTCEKPTPAATTKPSADKVLSTPAAPVTSGVMTLSTEQMNALYGAEEPQAVVAEVLSASIETPSTREEVCPSVSLSKYMLAGYCLLNECCPCGHRVPLVRSKTGVKVCCCGDSSCRYAERAKETATPRCTEVLDNDLTSIHEVRIAATKLREQRQSAPEVAVLQPEAKQDPSRAMGPYLLKGYEMLSQLCPNGHGVPLLKSKDGTLVCCCGDLSCEYAENGDSKSVSSKVQSSSAAPISQQPATLQEKHVTKERQCIEVRLHNHDFKFRSVSLVQSGSDRMILRGGSYVVHVRLSLQTDEDGRPYDMNPFRSFIASECKKMTDMVFLSKLSDRFKVVAQNGNIVVATSAGQLFTFLDSDRECKLLPCKNVDIDSIAEYLFFCFADFCLGKPLCDVVKWMEVTVNDSFAESTFRKGFDGPT